MTQSISGCEVTPRLSAFSDVFSKWVDLFYLYNASFPQAGNFWYNEPGFVAMLCSAAWNVRRPALVEARSIKTDSQTTWSGHADLLIQHDAERMANEAKLTWLSSESPGAQVLKCLASASEEAARLPPEFAQWRAGIVFGMFWLDGEADVLPACLEALAETRRTEPDILAWNTFTQRRQEQHCPGGLLVARIAV
jgi:hypothetical protein